METTAYLIYSGCMHHQSNEIDSDKIKVLPFAGVYFSCMFIDPAVFITIMNDFPVKHNAGIYIHISLWVVLTIMC